MASEGRYIPAAGHAAFTRFYDPFMALTMRERAWRPALRERVLETIPQDGVLVDLGAGTGRNAIDLASARPDIEVIAVDGDAEVLELAQAKPGAERISWRQGLAGQLDLADASADAIVISLVLHHLTPDAKRAALADAHRVLRPTGRLHVADWGRAKDPLMRAAFFAAQLLDGFATTSDHAAGRIPDYLTEAGFTSTTWRRVRTPGGTLDLIEANPADESRPA